MGVVREWSDWAVGYAPPRVLLTLLARRGDPIARLLTDTKPLDDIYPLRDVAVHLVKLCEQVAAADVVADFLAQPPGSDGRPASPRWEAARDTYR